MAKDREIPFLYFKKGHCRYARCGNYQCVHLAQYSNFDDGDLSRLRSDEKHNPSTETIVKIFLALADFADKVNIHDMKNYSMQSADQF